MKAATKNASTVKFTCHQYTQQRSAYKEPNVTLQSPHVPLMSELPVYVCQQDP